MTFQGKSEDEGKLLRQFYSSGQTSVCPVYLNYLNHLFGSKTKGNVKGPYIFNNHVQFDFGVYFSNCLRLPLASIRCHYV